MENSVSAPQYPLERAKQINTKLREKAMKPPREPMCLSRKAARAFSLKNRGFSADRLAMMVEGVYKLEKHGVRTGGFEGGGTSRETTFTTLQRRVRVPFLSGTSLQNSQRHKSLHLLEIPPEKKANPCGAGNMFILSFLPPYVVGVPSSISGSNSWKSGKVCVSRRVTTKGVKVVGVETPRSPAGAWI